MLTLADVITMPEIIALSLVQGAINAFDMPARHSFVVQMVENREDLGNAIAMNSSLVNAARCLPNYVRAFTTQRLLLRFAPCSYFWLWSAWWACLTPC